MAFSKLAARRLVAPSGRTMTCNVTLIDGSSTPQPETPDNCGKSKWAGMSKNP
jgi:hypothetical protein